MLLWSQIGERNGSVFASCETKIVQVLKHKQQNSWQGSCKVVVSVLHSSSKLHAADLRASRDSFQRPYGNAAMSKFFGDLNINLYVVDTVLPRGNMRVINPGTLSNSENDEFTPHFRAIYFNLGLFIDEP